MSSSGDRADIDVTPASVIAAVAALVALAGWASWDRITAYAVRLGYAHQASPPFAGVALTGWGRLAAAVIALGVLGGIAAGGWAAAIWRGASGGWAQQAVPLVPAWTARAAAAAATALAALGASAAAGVAAAAGLAAALVAGYLAAEAAAVVVDYVTTLALVTQLIEPLLGWDHAQRGICRLRRRGGEPARIEAQVGPNWTRTALAAIADEATWARTVPLHGMAWSYDERRRLVVAVRQG